MNNPASQLRWSSARELCGDLRSGKLTCVAVMQETYRRIQSLNGELNALVGLISESEALALAEQADQVPLNQRGPMHGLPMAPKDAVEVEGFATTWGFVPWANNVARKDDGLAARMRAAGAIFIGHSNMPEFGLGSNTFNSLYGRTHNPYDVSKTPGGSSGGAAVALATGMLPLADGSDMGGSLRNPASFCNVVGFRPSMGRMPMARGYAWLGRLSITGPMARTVADTAFLFSVQAGPDPHDPLTLPEAGSSFLDALSAPDNLAGTRVAYAPRLHGLPIHSEVMAVMEDAARAFSSIGAAVREAELPLHNAMDIFHVQRAAGLASLGNALDHTIKDWKQHAKESAIWNIEKGRSLTAAEILDAELSRSQLYAQMVDFFADYDAIILPAAQVPPFDSALEWVNEIEGQTMATYIDWMTICCAITVTGCPAISVPAGFTPDGLPVGVQIVGKPRGDLELLRIAHAYEQATLHYQRRPALCCD